MTAAERFQAWLRHLKSSGTSQEKLAEQLGWSQSLISAVARGGRRPGLDFAHAIEAATKDWEAGPIRTEEWLEQPEHEPAADPTTPEAA